MAKRFRSVPPWMAMIGCALGLLLGAVLHIPRGARAQEGVPMVYGASVTGTLPADGGEAAYIFNGNSGDLVMAQVVGQTPGMEPTITLLDPNQETLVSSADNPRPFASNDAAVDFRLITSGTYTVVVSGTAGDFLLTVQVRPVMVFTMLVPDTPMVASLPLEPANQVFLFNTNPTQVTTLFIDVEPVHVAATIELRNSTGQIVATLGNNLDSACLSLGPGDDAHEMLLRGTPDGVGSIIVTLSHTPCPSLVDRTDGEAEAIPFEPIALPGACAASSYLNVNVRTGPGLNYEVITLLLAETPIQVIGLSEDGSWYLAQGATFEGWIAAGVTFLTGPCEGLPSVPAPPPPAQAPTPGFHYRLDGGGPGVGGVDDAAVPPSQPTVAAPGTQGPDSQATQAPSGGGQPPANNPTDAAETPADGPDTPGDNGGIEVEAGVDIGPQAPDETGGIGVGVDAEVGGDGDGNGDEGGVSIEANVNVGGSEDEGGGIGIDAEVNLGLGGSDEEESGLDIDVDIGLG